MALCGGGKPSHLLIGDYLGADGGLSPDQLAAALISEIDLKQHELEQARHASNS